MKALLLPVSLLTLLSSAAFGQDYTIKISRPQKVGDTCKTTVDGKQSQATDVTVNGAPQKSENKAMEVQFEGTEKVVEVGANGNATKETVTVDKFSATPAGGAASDLLPKGTVVNASVEGKKQVYEVDGKPVSPDVAQALDMAISLEKGNATDDEIFGTTEKKKKGDTWDINVEKAKADFQKQTEMEISDMTGKVTLVDVTGDTMTFSAKITGTVKPPLPPVFTIDQAATEATINGTLPVDVTKNLPAQETQALSVNFAAHADAPSGEKIVMKAVVSQSVTRKSVPVK